MFLICTVLMQFTSIKNSFIYYPHNSQAWNIYFIEDDTSVLVQSNLLISKNYIELYYICFAYDCVSNHKVLYYVIHLTCSVLRRSSAHIMTCTVYVTVDVYSQGCCLPDVTSTLRVYLVNPGLGHTMGSTMESCCILHGNPP